MFNFGDPEEQARMYWDSAVGSLGPLLPDVHIHEMSLQDVRHALAYARMAYEAAERAGADGMILARLMGRHDGVFAYLAGIDDDFRGRVLGSKPGRQPVWLGGYHPDNIAKYKSLASAN